MAGSPKLFLDTENEPMGLQLTVWAKYSTW